MKVENARVIGVVFDDCFRSIALTRKGEETRFAGIEGCAVDEDNRPRDTMSRVCKDVTGLDVPAARWRVLGEFINITKKIRVCAFVISTSFADLKPGVMTLPIEDGLWSALNAEMDILVPLGLIALAGDELAGSGIFEFANIVTVSEREKKETIN